MNCDEVRPAYQSCLCPINNLTLCFFFPCSALSSYPSYGGAASILDPEAEQFLDSAFEDPPVKNKEDWIDDQDAAVVTQGLSSKMAEAMVIEVWFFFHLN